MMRVWFGEGTRASRSARTLYRTNTTDANGKPFGDVRVPGTPLGDQALFQGVEGRVCHPFA